MRPADRSRALQRRSRYETFEERLALTAQPLGDTGLANEQRLQQHYSELAPAQLVNTIGDFQLETIAEERISQHIDSVTGASGDVHDLTGVNYVFNNFGITGQGQTVAVIDSGIAWDHVALGGGFGTDYRVVGGYDFAEGDDDPYDDGPTGFHGTHVAGIIGSTDAEHRGVASGVDLVGLRVFDDDGAGYFQLVEEALQWVHDHQNDFESPITTVNLSLGSTWNSDSVPAWATLEDEFAQLEEDGIFIAVSAGNSFSEYDAAGLSYPAASPYVVPVASVDIDGAISGFSQRSDRVLAAPGSYITSTVPDHVFGADGYTNDFGTSSGTSMAAPYVAGASVLVRQAMEFAGVQSISQDSIYNHLRDTADIVYDSVTSANYHLINLEAAISALIPTDDFGSTAGAAHSLGAVANGSSFAGMISNVTDADYFTFVAAQTGQATFSFDTTGELTLDAELIGGSASFTGDALTLDVIAGQSYTLALSTADGIGHYSVDVSLAASSSGSGSGSSKDESSSGSQVTVDPIAKAAYELDQSKGLTFSGDDYLNWGGTNEKWLQGSDGWYFVRPDGEVYKWSGSGKANGTLVATLDASYYADLSKLFGAQAPAATGEAASEGESSGDTTSGGETANGTAGDSGESNAGTGNESGNGTTDGGTDSGGDTGSGGAGSSSDNESSLAGRARELDAEFGFTTDGNYYENWAGLGEKWFQSDDLGWVFITPDGSVYDWNGNQAAAASSDKVAQLDSSFHQDVTLLTDPPAADSGTSSGDQSGGDQTSESNQGSNGNTDSGQDTESGSSTGSGNSNQGGSEASDGSNADTILAKRAYERDQQLGLGSSGDYYHDWAGLGEKWLTSTSGQWYFITPDGSLYQWNGSQIDADSSGVVATFDSTFHADPGKLHAAPTVNTLSISLKRFSVHDSTSEVIVGVLYSGSGGSGYLGEHTPSNVREKLFSASSDVSEQVVIGDDSSIRVELFAEYESNIDKDFHDGATAGLSVSGDETLVLESLFDEFAVEKSSEL